MALVRRGNCEYTIADGLVEEYLAKGYSLLDSTGKVIREKTPESIAEHKAKIEALEQANAELQAKNEELTKEIETLRAAATSAPEKPGDAPEKPAGKSK